MQVLMIGNVSDRLVSLSGIITASGYQSSAIQSMESPYLPYLKEIKTLLGLK